MCHLHILLQAATDPDLFGGGQISFRKATSSPLNKLSCFSVNRCSHYPMHIVTDVCMVEGRGLVCPLSCSLHRESPIPSVTVCIFTCSTTGAIRLEDSLDRETDPLISLTISAHDNGEPSKTVTVAGTHFTK